MKRKTLHALTSVTACQFPLTRSSAFRSHCHIPQIHCRHNSIHGPLTCNGFNTNGISWPCFCTDVDGNFHCWSPHWKIPLSGPCLLQAPASPNWSILCTTTEVHFEQFDVGFDSFVFNDSVSHQAPSVCQINRKFVQVS